MHHIEKIAILQHNIEKLYGIVADINRYPEFVPWCSGMEILAQSDANNFTARVTINTLGFHIKYISHVLLQPPSSGTALIRAHSDQGPFDKMDSCWLLEQLGENQTKATFTIKIALKSKTLGFLLQQALPVACSKIMQAFIQRSQEA